MFLFILILILLIHLTNLYHFHNTKKNLIGLGGIIIICLLNIYDILSKKHRDKENYHYINCVQITILIISLIFIVYYCTNNYKPSRLEQTPSKTHILQHLF